VAPAMRIWWSTLLLGAALTWSRPPSAQAGSAIRPINVRAEILSNCLLEVQTKSALPSIRVDLRCTQEMVARIAVAPKAHTPGDPRPSRPSTLTVAKRGGRPDAEGWLASGHFLASTEGLWSATLADHEDAPAPDDRLTVHVDF